MAQAHLRGDHFVDIQGWTRLASSAHGGLFSVRRIDKIAIAVADFSLSVPGIQTPEEAHFEN